MGILDFGASRSSSSSRSQSQGTSEQHIFGPQADALTFAFPQAQGIAQRQLSEAGELAPQLSGQLLGQAQSFFGQLDVNNNPFLQGLAQFQGGLAGQVDPLIDQLGMDINRQLGRDQFSAGQQQSISGNRGGGRHGVAQGILQEGAINAFSREAANLRFGAAQQDQNQQLQALLGGGQISTGAAGAGLSQLGGVFDLGLGGLSGQFSPLESLANLLPATVLGSSQQTASARSSSSSGEFNVGFG